MVRKKSSRPLTEIKGFAIISDYFKSGMGCREFYLSHNISEWQFYKWKRLYLQEHPEVSKRKSVVYNPSPLFHPVEICGNHASSGLPPVKVEFANGNKLHIGEGLRDISILHELLKI